MDTNESSVTLVDENLGLQAALTNYVGHWSKHFGIRVQLHTGPSTDERLTPRR